jgi:hypothetical protein
MNLPGERILKNSEVNARLGVTDYQRRQLVEKGILDAPIDAGGKHPQHTLSQIERALKRISRQAASTAAPKASSARPTRPLSREMISRIRNAQFS